MLSRLLEFLDGKKAILLGIAGIIIGYLTTVKVITPELATAILSILNIVAGSAVIATNSVLGKRNLSGVRTKYAN